MKAALLNAFGRPLVIEDVPTPKPGPEEVLVRVRACGIDGTDLKLLEGFGYTPQLPFIMGHEPAGEVAESGDRVAGFKIGDRVIPYIFFIPRESPWYATPREQLCPHMLGVLGVKGIPGGYAEYLVVPAHQLLAVPASVEFSDAAVLCDAGLTAFHTVERAQLKAGQTVLIIGVGGVGSFAVQFAALKGARVIAADRSEPKAEHARRLGAHVAFDASSCDLRDLVQDETNGNGLDCVLDIVGTTATLSVAVDCLKPGGRLVVVGYTPDAFSVAGKRLAQNELEIIGSRGGSRADLAAAIQLMASGNLRSIVTDSRPLEQVNEAHQQLRSGNVLGRLVLTT